MKLCGFSSCCRVSRYSLRKISPMCWSVRATLVGSYQIQLFQDVVREEISVAFLCLCLRRFQSHLQQVVVTQKGVLWAVIALCISRKCTVNPVHYYEMERISFMNEKNKPHKDVAEILCRGGKIVPDSIPRSWNVVLSKSTFSFIPGMKAIEHSST